MKPSDGDMATILKPLADLIGEIQEFREKGRRSDLFNHLSAVSESIPALGWVTVSPAPAPFVLEMFNAGQFYTNRVLKDFKGKAAVHVEWVKAWGQCLAELQAYVKQFHTTGLVWSKTGGDAIMVARQPNKGEAPPQGPPAGPPGAPPPPPPPPPPALAEVAEVSPEVASRGALMQSLNAGTEITAKLKKVTDEEKTHKNPALRGDGLVKAKENGLAAAQNGNGMQKPPRLGGFCIPFPFCAAAKPFSFAFTSPSPRRAGFLCVFSSSVTFFSFAVISVPALRDCIRAPRLATSGATSATSARAGGGGGGGGGGAPGGPAGGPWGGASPLFGCLATMIASPPVFDQTSPVVWNCLT